MTPLYRPTAERIARSNMTRFLAAVGSVDYPAAYAWSVAEPAAFWRAVWDFTGVIARVPGVEVVDDPARMPGARWFAGARLNFAENLLRYRDQQPALIFKSERGDTRTLSYAELYAAVARVARALRAQGVVAGDRVAGFLPNLPEAVIAMLAATSIGAIWSSSSPDFGIQGVLDRFGQIAPKVLFAADGYPYAGKQIDSLERLRGILARLPSVERTVIVPYLQSTPDLSGLANATSFGDFSSEAATEIEFEPLPFDHPLYILYSSGTTGVPKCIVHGAGGTLLQHLKELVLHTDLTRADRIFYFTTCGWMMWNWLVSSLAVGATVMLYDGAPAYPAPDALWQWAEESGISIFGTSAKYLAAQEKAGVRADGRQLAALRTILSTGSPLLPESFDYVYRDIKADVCLSSISGGTDIVSCFALGNPILPVYRGELQCRGLGMKVEILADDGTPVRGAKGELSCSQAFPSMPIYFWNDPDGSRYRQSYFERFPGIWCHGDWAELSDTDGMIIYGRSDATLNPGGVRIGTAEIYRVVEQIAEVQESLVVGLPVEGDVEVILFVVTRAGATLDAALEQTIKSRLRADASPRHVPKKIFAVPAIPRTISGKITELAVLKVLLGQEVKNQDALANPEALDFFATLRERL